MKVAIVSCEDFIEGHSSNARIKAYAKGLQGLGVDVNILLLSALTDNKINRQVSGTWQGISFQYLNKKSYRPAAKLGKMADNFRSAFFSLLHLFQKGRHYDLLYLYNPTIMFFWPVILAAKVLKIPVVAEWPELHSLHKTPKTIKFRFARLINKFDEANSQYYADHLLVISHNIYKHFRKYLPEDKISILPITVDFERFKETNTQKSFKIGYIGSFAEKDGVIGILTAFKNALDTVPELNLRLIGYDNGSAKQVANDLEIQSKVEFPGHVSFEDVPSLLGECDLLLMNRTNSPYANHGFPIKLGEYLATGRPTIVTRVGDAEEYLQHEVDTYMIEPDNDRQLTEAILLRYKEYERFNEIGRKGRDTAKKHFSHVQHIAKMLEIFEKTIADKKGREKPL